MIINLGSVKADLENNTRGVGEALAECERELNLRIRMYPEWIKSRKLSALDAKDRLERLARACATLQRLYDGEGDRLAMEVATERLPAGVGCPEEAA